MMATLGWLWTATYALAATPPRVPCTYGAPTNPRPEATSPARVLIEVRVDPDTPVATLDATLGPLVDAGLPVVVLVPIDWTPDTPGYALPSRAVDVGLLTTLDDLVGQPIADPGAMFMSDWRSALKQGRRAVQKATGVRPRVLAMPTPPVTGELAIDDAGLQVFLPIDPGNAAPPRRARAAGGRTGRTRIVTEGVSSDQCGALLGAPLQSALDRVTLTAPAKVVSRVALPADPEAARALVLWWRTVAQPAEWRAWSVSTAYVRAGAPPLAPKPEEAAVTPGITIETTRLTDASSAIVAAKRLPRLLPGELNLTEALVGLMAVVTDPGHEAYTVPVVGPPHDQARSTLNAPVRLSDDAMRAAAERLLPALQTSVPSLVTVGEHTLTTAEFLLALAHMHRGEAATARAVGSPDPYAPGAGWGSVRSP